MLCSKSKYATEKFALDDIARIKSKSTRCKVPVAAYLCRCGFWHLTSQPNKDARIKELEVLVEKKKLEMAGNMHVSIEEYKTSPNDKDVIYYIIKVLKRDGQIFKIDKRFSEFDELNKKLK